MSVVSEARSTPIPSSVSSRTLDRRPLVTSVALAAGVVLVAVGGFLPWLVVFNGLTSIPGFRLGGGAPAGVAVAAAGLVLVAAHRGGRWVRWVAALASAAAAGYVLYLAHGVLGYVADPGPTGPLLMPRAGIGAYLMAAGAVVVLAAALVARPRRATLSRTATMQLALAAVTFAAGWVHLLLAPEHLEEHPLLGVGFIAAGAAQVALAAVILARPAPTVMSLLVVLDVAILAVYAYAVLVGLPFAADGDASGMAGMGGMGGDDHDHGLVVGAGEPVDVLGAATFVMELLGVGLVIALVRRLTTRPDADALTR